MSRTIKLLISNGPRMWEFSQLLQTGKLLLTFLTMVTRLSRSTVLCKRNANEICRNKRNYANFGNQIANFRFRRKSGEISVLLLFSCRRNFASRVINRNEISRHEAKFRCEISCSLDEISCHWNEVSLRRSEISFRRNEISFGRDAISLSRDQISSFKNL